MSARGSKETKPQARSSSAFLDSLTLNRICLHSAACIPDYREKPSRISKAVRRAIAKPGRIVHVEKPSQYEYALDQKTITQGYRITVVHAFHLVAPAEQESAAIDCEFHTVFGSRHPYQPECESELRRIAVIVTWPHIREYVRDTAAKMGLSIPDLPYLWSGKKAGQV